MIKIRTGFGYDMHALVPNRELWMGGIQIDHPCGLLGHSDADVLIHALCDALLGAANLGDIGTHFSDTDPAFEGIDSKKLLTQTMQLIRQAGYEIGNMDATVVAEQPKLKPHIPAMRQKLAQVMQADPDALSIKATTSEKMGFVGRSEGIAAYATVLIVKE